MNSLLTVILLLISADFPMTIERAFTSIQNRDWRAAAAALDEAAAEDSVLFDANGLAYLRGRVAENQSDWARARDEFQEIASGHPLRSLAAWHAAMAAARLRSYTVAEQLFRELPSNFPDDLKMELARASSPDFALQIYTSMSTRDARFERARMNKDRTGLFNLLRERKDDDVGLRAAHLVSAMVSTPRETLDVAETFVAHRQFDYARPLYESTAQDPHYAAESRYQLARIQFLKEDFRSAVNTYSAIAKDFAGSNWERDADYQIASCYWRLGEFRDSEKAYVRYINKYGSRGMQEGAIRNLVDVYRVLGENTKALEWIDRALAKRLSVASRQVFLFTKAKVQFTQKRYSAATALFRQLSRTTLRSAPGGTTKDEARYFEALSLSKSGNSITAKAIWKQLAAEPYSYYGAKASEKLGQTPKSATAVCPAASDAILASAENGLSAMRRPLRTPADPIGDTVSELLYLRLWDEAALWKERANSKLDNWVSAELAYAGGRYHRSIAYADKLSRNDATALGLLYPAGFRDRICAAAGKNNIDPLWMHAIIWQESKYNPYSRSAASARGLMQFIPETANRVGAEIGIAEFSLEKLYDPAVNIPMGAYYWASLMRELKSPVMALAAYNGGIDNVRRWKSKWPEGDDEFFVADIGFTETKRYVMAVYGARVAYGALVK